MLTPFVTKLFIRRLAYRSILASVVAFTAITTAYANLPTLGDPTLDSFSSKEEQQLGLGNIGVWRRHQRARNLDQRVARGQELSLPGANRRTPVQCAR